MWSSTLGIMTATPAPVVAAPAPVVEYIQPATFQTATAMMTVTGVDMNRIGIPDVLLVRISLRCGKLPLRA